MPAFFVDQINNRQYDSDVIYGVRPEIWVLFIFSPQIQSRRYSSWRSNGTHL